MPEQNVGGIKGNAREQAIFRSVLRDMVLDHPSLQEAEISFDNGTTLFHLPNALWVPDEELPLLFEEFKKRLQTSSPNKQSV